MGFNQFSGEYTFLPASGADIKAPLHKSRIKDVNPLYHCLKTVVCIQLSCRSNEIQTQILKPKHKNN